jgi:Ca2+-binding RTX toxin-like protein
MSRFIAVILGTILVLGVGTANAATETIFDYIPASLPDNVASYSYESWGVAEAGDGIEFSTNGPQALDNAKVVVSSWACQTGTGWAQENTVPCSTTPGSTFSVPITLKIYDPNDDMSVVVSKTQTFAIPFRPSSNPACPDTVNGHGWGAGCLLGKSHIITFDLTGVTAPDEIVYGVAWNTSSYGYDPIGDEAECAAVQYAGCPYDLLNLGTDGDAPATIGTDLSPNGAWQYSVFPSAYCDGGEGGSSVFRFDNGCWDGFNPLVRFSRFVADTGGGGGGGGTTPPTDCTIIGTPGHDVLTGSAGPDIICGKGGDDVLRGRKGDDLIRGGRGQDFIRGGLGFDTCKGGPGKDTIKGCEA